MELIKQVVSLELSKKLKELGMKHESLFHWFKYDARNEPLNTWEVVYMEVVKRSENKRRKFFAAFTVAELGELLPQSILTGDVHNQQFTDRFQNKWLVGYANMRDDDINFVDTEADARAEALIWLIENGLLSTSVEGV